MKKYMLLGISVFSMAVDISVSAGYSTYNRDSTEVYSLGVAQGVRLGDLPITFEIGADLHYHVSGHDCYDCYDSHDYYDSSDKFKSLPSVAISAHTKALFLFTEFDSIIIGHSLHSNKSSNELHFGKILGFRRQVSDDQSFQCCFESVEASETNEGMFTHGESKLTFTATKSFSQD